MLKGTMSIDREYACLSRILYNITGHSMSTEQNDSNVSTDKGLENEDESFLGLSDSYLENLQEELEDHPTATFGYSADSKPPQILPEGNPDTSIVSLDELNCASISGGNSVGGQSQNVSPNRSMGPGNGQPNQSPMSGQQVGNVPGAMNQSYGNQSANCMSPGQGVLNVSNPTNLTGSSMNSGNNSRSNPPSPANSPGRNFGGAPLNTSQPGSAGSPYRGQSQGASINGRQMPSPGNVSPYQQTCAGNNMSPGQGAPNNSSNMMKFSPNTTGSNSGRGNSPGFNGAPLNTSQTMNAGSPYRGQSPNSSANGRQMPSPRNGSPAQQTCAPAANMSPSREGNGFQVSPLNTASQPANGRQTGQGQPYGPRTLEQSKYAYFESQMGRNVAPFDNSIRGITSSPQPSPDRNSGRASGSSMGGASDAVVMDMLINNPDFQNTLRQTIQAQVQESINRVWDKQLDELVPILLSKFLNLHLPNQIETRMFNGSIERPIPCQCLSRVRSTDSGFLQNVSTRMEPESFINEGS